MDAVSYQNKPEILILNFTKKERSEIVFLHTAHETNKIKTSLFYSYDEYCKETILKLIIWQTALLNRQSIRVKTCKHRNSTLWLIKVVKCIWTLQPKYCYLKYRHLFDLFDGKHSKWNSRNRKAIEYIFSNQLSVRILKVHIPFHISMTHSIDAWPV